MPKYATGTKLQVTMEVTVTNNDSTGSGHSTDRYVMVKDDGGMDRSYHHILYGPGIDSGAVKVTVLSSPEPANWPPKEDDVWRDKSGLVFHYIGGMFRRKNLFDDGTRSIETSKVAIENLTLVYRRY